MSFSIFQLYILRIKSKNESKENHENLLSLKYQAIVLKVDNNDTLLENSQCDEAIINNIVFIKAKCLAIYLMADINLFQLMTESIKRSFIKLFNF